MPSKGAHLRAACATPGSPVYTPTACITAVAWASMQLRVSGWEAMLESTMSASVATPT